MQEKRKVKSEKKKKKGKKKSRNPTSTEILFSQMRL